MKNDRFANVIPQAPASFGYAVERALHETEAESMNKKKFSISLVWVMIALLALAGAALAVGGYLGISDIIGLVNKTDVPPGVETEYIGAQFTAGGIDLKLVEYNYEGDRLTLLFSMEGYTDAWVPDVFTVSAGDCKILETGGSGYSEEAADISYFLAEYEVEDGADLLNVVIADIADGRELFSFEARRASGAEAQENEVVVLDAVMEGTGYTIVNCDVDRTTLNTQLDIYIDVDPEAVELTGYITEDQQFFQRTGNVWHMGCDISAEDPDAVPVTAAEIMTGDFTPCTECVAAEWWKSMGRPELFDVELLRIGSVTDENGMKIPFGYGFGLADAESGDPLKLKLTIDIDNSMLDELPDVIFLKAADYYRTWDFPDTAAVDVSALKAE